MTVIWLLLVTPVVALLGQWWVRDYWGDEWADIGTYFVVGAIIWLGLAVGTVAAWRAARSN